ncbi:MULTISPECIES: hypothetical protein [unclassified Burkholderia]|uniref:hypothetical protein n=1 Tax=unclassified Burkholderia TaxID=2613784 RepID=UPI00117FDCE2|nr:MULTISPECIES: hypothetical protein [unclassified Burkholderia]MDN7426571.1 hypothetical protein [Burkholderia sp. AU45388]
MKAITATAVATATVASNISCAQPVPASDLPAALPGSLRYAQPDDAPQMAPVLTSRLNTAQQASSPTNQSVSLQGGKEVAQMISRPKTPVEFVQNLKVIFDGDLLLQDAFYTEENLKNIFNLEEVSIFDDVNGADRQISIMASVPGSVIPRRKVPEAFGGSIPGANFVGGKTINQSGVTTAVINFGMYEGGPDFNAAQKIFKSEFVRVPPQPSPHGGPGAATAPHGNETWRCQIVDSHIDKTITVGFNPAGELSRIIIDIKK